MNKHRLEVEVESLSDARWARIDRGLFAQLDADKPAPMQKVVRPVSHIHMYRAAGLLAVAAALLLAFVRPWASPTSSVAARIATTASASNYSVGDAALTIARDSIVIVTGDDTHGVDVVLDSGSVTCDVAPRGTRPAFVVDAGEVRVRVVGTLFTVTREGKSASVLVDHGVVEVSWRGTVVASLHDGQRWPADSRSTGLRSAGLGAPSSVADAQAHETANGSLAAEARRTGALSAPPEALPIDPPTTKDSLGAAGHGHTTRHDGSHKAHAASAIDHSVSDTAPTPLTTVTGTEMPAVPESAAAKPSARESYESAARLERSSPDRAEAIYRDLSAGGGSWAPNALYALARLESDRGRRGEARRLLETYLARYPRGANAADARALLERTQ